MSESTLLGLQSSIGVALANSLEVHRKEEALELYRPDKQTYSSLLLETWLNEILHTSSEVNLGSNRGPFKGLAAFSIDKASLQSAGLSGEAIGHLYRALYVYTIGFQDKVRKLFVPVEHKQLPLNNIWRAYLAIAESAMEVGFKSLFLDSLSGQQAQAAEVALAQAAAREAVGERGELEHMLTWLTGAHAEEAAMHRTFKAEATGLKEHFNREKATNQELVQQCSSAAQNVKAMEDEVRLVKRQLAIMAKARDVACQEKEDWKSTCNSQEKMMQHVGAGLVAIQGATRLRPPDPESVAAAVVIHAAPGSEAAAKYLLFKLDSMIAQATSLHEEWVSEKSQRIQLTERLVKQSARLSDQIMLNEANANRISILSADKEHLQAQLADIEALRIVPLYKSIDSLTADIAARDNSILAHQSSLAALQAQIGRLEAALDVKRGKKQAYKTAFTGKIEIEKELRRQLLEVDEHSSHQGRQLERLQEHTVAMHALAPGMLILQRSLQQNRAARKMLNERLQEARAGKLHAEREHAKAEAVAAGLQHDLELLKHQTASAIANEQKHRQVQASLQDALATKKEEARQLLADKTAALKEISDLQQQLKEGQGSANQLAAEKAAEQKQHEQQTAQLEAQIQALDSLRYDLEQAKANLTAKLELSSAANTALEIQILEEKAKAEQAQIMMNNSSDSCSRQRKREKKRHYKVALLQETEQLQAALLHKDVRIAELNHRIDKVRGKARPIKTKSLTS
ncbi:hypothetical protein WJX82_003177 [Trebouxia sp. C0006]